MQKTLTANLIWAGAIAGFLLLVPLPVGTDQLWIDPVSGSHRTVTSYLGVPIRSRITPSALERWIIDHEGACTSKWHLLSRASFTIFGGYLAVGCREAPPICLVAYHADGGLLTKFIKQASDAEIAEFLRMMRTGTRPEQEAAVKAIAVRY
jgi:hypothetical protein